MNTNENETTERESIEALLPWYATGRLDQAETEQVEAYLASHPEMADQLALVDEERAETVQVNEMRGAPRPGALDRLMADIGQYEKDNPSLAAAGTALWGWASRLVGAPVPAKLQWVAAAAAVLIVLQGVSLGVLMTSGTGTLPGYETASGPARQAAQGSFALIQFSQAASVDAITEFLAENELVIVDGPKPGGVYKVRIAASALDESKRDTILKQLLAHDDLIVFAAPTE